MVVLQTVAHQMGFSDEHRKAFRIDLECEEEKRPLFAEDNPDFRDILREFMMGENRFSSLTRTFPERAEMLFAEAEEFNNRRYAKYKKLAAE